MPSAANLKSEKAASAEASDNSPIRQIVTLIEHKIRNLEKRKSKLTSYRDLQKAGKELNSDQKVAVAKYDEVAQTLEFARELAKNVASVATAAEREAKKQAKKDAWVRYASDTAKIREVLLIVDCLTQMGNNEAREDFLNGTNGAAKLTEEDLNILDNLYPEVTPKHEVNEEGQPGFQSHVTKAAEHLYAIIDGKSKEVLGTTYTHIKQIITSVHECGYFDKVEGVEEQVEEEAPVPSEPPVTEPPLYAAPLPVPPAAAVVPAPGYPLCPLPPITLQEVEHAYFSQQYPQQRPISEVIGSQNFFFLQESEIDSPVGTPQPPPVMGQPSPPSQIPSQTFTNQHFVQISGGRVPGEPLPPPHFVPPPEHAYPPTIMAAPPAPVHAAIPASAPLPVPTSAPTPAPVSAPSPPAPTPSVSQDDEWNESPERDDRDEQADRAKTQGQGDGQSRFRRYGRGPRAATNGYRNRGGYQSRQGGEREYNSRHNDYRDRPSKEHYQSRQYNDTYQSRHKDSYQTRNNDTYYGNGDTGNGHRDHDNGGGRDRYEGGYKGRGRGGGRGPRGAGRGTRPPRAEYTRHHD